jgi:hypothetical protein
VKPDLDRQAEEKLVGTTKKVMVGLGSALALVGLIRQWPTLGKGYMEFIEGPGYIGFITGLVMIVLGFSVRLLMGRDE